MTKKESCVNTEYTNGFKITTAPDGTFVAVKGKNKFEAKSAKEIYELIKNISQTQK
jgi:hypothetical protein